MKKAIVTLAVLQAALLLTAGEIIKNADLSKGMEGWYQFKGKKPLVKPEIITEKGKKCFQFTKEKGQDVNFYSNIKLKPGKYTISYEVKADPAPTGNLYTHMYIYVHVMKNGKKTGIGYASTGEKECGKKLADGWTKVSKVIDIPQGMETILIHFVASENYEGTVLFRNMSIQDVAAKK